MKKIFTFSALALVLTLALSSCVKNRGYYGVDEGYWLAKERGEVVYSDPYCSYYVVETYYGFNIVQAYGNYKPREGDMVYGNFSARGTRDLYNYSAGFVFTGTVTDFWLSYAGAQDALDYYCPLGGKGTTTRVFKKSTIREETK